MSGRICEVVITPRGIREEEGKTQVFWSPSSIFFTLFEVERYASEMEPWIFARKLLP